MIASRVGSMIHLPLLRASAKEERGDTDQASADLENRRSIVMRLGLPSGRDTYIGTSELSLLHLAGEDVLRRP